MRVARMLVALVAGLLAVGAAVWWSIGIGGYTYELGSVNSVRASTANAAGQLCVSDSYDENHCRAGQPLILPVEPLVEGDCVEVRTKRRSRQIGVRKVNAEACAGGPYDSDR